MLKEKKEIIADEKELDEMYISYLKSEIEKGEKNIKEGKVITLKELKNFIDGLEARYEADNTRGCPRKNLRNI